MFFFVVVSALASVPLQVRVLAKEQPSTATLAARDVRCSGASLERSVALSVLGSSLQVQGKACAQLTAVGDVVVTVGDVTRRYPGAMKVGVEQGALRFVNEVDVEAYLPSVVAGELGDAPLEAQKAQAIVSRTFALASRKRHGPAGYDLCDLTHCQLYRGEGDETKATKTAVAETAGQVLLIGGVVLRPTFFHAACGGHTSRAQDVFQTPASSVVVSDERGGKAACSDAESFSWAFEVERSALAQALTLREVGPAFVPLRRDEGGRVLELEAFNRRFTGVEFLSRVGHALGWQAIRSMHVTAREHDGVVTFAGSGLGHGVGLCQQGARTLAREGQGAAAILLKYFPDSKVRTAP